MSALEGMASAVEADAAQFRLVDDRHGFSHLGRADGGHIPAGTRTDDQHVDFFDKITDYHILTPP